MHYFISLLALVYVNQAESEPRLSARALSNEFPYQVSIQLRGSHVCGGALISMRHVLTVAHCVFEQDEYKRMIPSKLSHLEVVAGTVDKLNYNPRGQSRSVQTVKIHRQYSINDDNMDNDIALIEVTEEFFTTSEIMAIQLQEANLSENDICLSSGWGVTRIMGLQPRYMTKVPFPLFDHDKCKRRYGDKLTENMFCAGFQEHSKHVCQGESGSPLMCNEKLTGLLSWGYGCVSISNPMVFVNVTQYYDWIDQRSKSGASVNLRISYIMLISVIYLLIK